MATNNSLNAPIPFGASKGGTGVASPTAHGILVAEGSSPVNPIVLGAGQILVGTTASDPAATTLTAGEGISIASVSGAITITATSQIVTWNTESGTSANLVKDNGYVSTSEALCTFTLPTSVELGDEYQVVALGAGGFKIIPGNTTQTIRLGTSVTTADTGSLQSTAIGDVIDLVCVDATSGAQKFMVISSTGDITVL
jgi:hypothetical protein